jgi:4-amino-4-deoxychorismate lyase
MMPLVNGIESDTVGTSDRGLNYGDGLFETMRLVGGKIPMLDRHLERLRDGCRRLHLAWPRDSRLRKDIAATVGEATEGVVKLIITRGQGGRGYRPDPGAEPTRVVSITDLPSYPAAHYRQGVRVRICQTRMAENSATGGLKHLCRLEQVLASLEGGQQDVDEGIMLGIDGAVIEGIRSNVFIVTNGEVFTPDLVDAGVAGVMRAVVLDALRERGIRVRICRVAMEEFMAADEIFLTNSIFGVWGVRDIQGSVREMKPGTVTRGLIRAFADKWRPSCAA